MSSLDIFGWVFSAIYAVGNISVARKHRTGWLFRIVGATGWIWVGLSVGLTSIFFIEGTAVITSIYGFYKWGEKKEEKMKKLPKPKHKYGYPKSQLKEILKDLKINPEVFDRVFGHNTMTLDEATGETIFYVCDVEKALNKMGHQLGRFHPWD